jgi:hypothetical protein
VARENAPAARAGWPERKVAASRNQEPKQLRAHAARRTGSADGERPTRANALSYGPARGTKRGGGKKLCPGGETVERGRSGKRRGLRTRTRTPKNSSHKPFSTAATSRRTTSPASTRHTHSNQKSVIRISWFSCGAKTQVRCSSCGNPAKYSLVRDREPHSQNRLQPPHDQQAVRRGVIYTGFIMTPASPPSTKKTGTVPISVRQDAFPGRILWLSRCASDNIA